MLRAVDEVWMLSSPMVMDVTFALASCALVSMARNSIFASFNLRKLQACQALTSPMHLSRTPSADLDWVGSTASSSWHYQHIDGTRSREVSWSSREEGCTHKTVVAPVRSQLRSGGLEDGPPMRTLTVLLWISHFNFEGTQLFRWPRIKITSFLLGKGDN